MHTVHTHTRAKPLYRDVTDVEVFQEVVTTKNRRKNIRENIIIVEKKENNVMV